MSISPIETPSSPFRQELLSAERDIAASAMDWAVREADLERKLTRLLSRFAAATAPRPVAPRNAVRLYSSRWCHIARSSVALAE
jgi:hypothetical protein